MLNSLVLQERMGLTLQLALHRKQFIHTPKKFNHTTISVHKQILDPFD